MSLPSSLLQVAELNAKVQELEAQFNAAVEDKEAAIKESERCQLKLQLANRLINALASEGESAWINSTPSFCVYGGSMCRYNRQHSPCTAFARIQHALLCSLHTNALTPLLVPCR